MFRVSSFEFEVEEKTESWCHAGSPLAEPASPDFHNLSSHFSKNPGLSLLFVISLILLSLPTSAQQLPIFSLYRENSFILNPAITGNEDHAIAAATYRDQWSGMDGRPRTMSGSYRAPIYRTNMGIGGMVINDVTGPTAFTGATVTYAYHFTFKKVSPFSWGAFLRKSKISLGLAASAYQYRLNSSELILENPNDLAISDNNQNAIRPNAGVGLYYYYDHVFMGFSAPQLIPFNVKFNADDGNSVIRRVNHFNIVLGGSAPLGGKVPRGHYNKIYLEPVAWFKYVKGAPLQYDAYLRVRHKNFFWAGAGYRSSKTLVLDAGFLIRKQVQFGYAYDLQVSQFRADLGNTHELIVAYHFQSKKGRSFGVK